MNRVNSKLYRFLLPAAVLLAASFSLGAFAETEGVSPWQDVAHSRIRLISASDIPHQTRVATVAGVEIVLDKGWKTYWRTPGDGLPPSIDWAASENLEKAELLWPAPKRFDSAEGLSSIGYDERVIIPILIVPRDWTKPVQLRLQITYGVCAEICIPVETTLALTIPVAEHSIHRDALIAALNRVPKQQQRGVYCPHSFITAKNRIVNGAPALLIKTAFDDQATGLDLFAEAPEGFDLPTPVRQPRASRGRLYHIIGFEDAKAMDALKGKLLTLTMVSDQGSCETSWRVK